MRTRKKKKILTIDDEEIVRQAIADFLEDCGHDVCQAENGKIGLEVFERERPDLVLTDLRMPVMGGMDVLAAITKLSPGTPVIIVSGTGDISDAVEAVRLGAWDYIIKPVQDTGVIEHALARAFERAELLEENLRYREHLEDEIKSRTAEIEIRSSELEKLLEKLKKTYDGSIKTISKICDIRDPYTGGHQQRVANLACAIAREMGLAKEHVDGLYTAGMLHDVGKIAVPIEILCKPGKLDSVEIMVLKIHPEVGSRILEEIEFTLPISQIVLQHHERLDGSGYPMGISGDNIMLEARIISIADVVEAMASHRPYRPALGDEQALAEIKKHRNTLYDPDVADICVKLFTEKKFSFADIYSTNGPLKYEISGRKGTSEKSLHDNSR